MSEPNPQPKMAVVILAAGEGKRMKSAGPKVMQRLSGRPVLDYVVAAVADSGLVAKPVIIVSPKQNVIQDYFGDRANYVEQAEPLGTAHAVAQAEPALVAAGTEHVVVLYGDMPLISPGSIIKLVASHQAAQAVVTLMTVTVADFDSWRVALSDFGRIVRDPAGRIIKSVEKRDATAEELASRELNSCYYCFRADWLWPALRQLKNNNNQQEYYLTDLIRLAIDQGEKIETVPIDPREAIGINTLEQLAAAEQL